MTFRSQLVSILTWPFKKMVRGSLGEQLYQQVRVTFLCDQQEVGLDWRWCNSLRRLHPIRRDFGWQEGHPIDRYYTEDQFLAGYKGDIRGRVLEIGDNRYTCQFGGRRVIASDVLYLKPRISGATSHADLTMSPQQ